MMVSLKSPLIDVLPTPSHLSWGLLPISRIIYQYQEGGSLRQQAQRLGVSLDEEPGTQDPVTLQIPFKVSLSLKALEPFL